MRRKLRPRRPPEGGHPIEIWSDHELVDQYRYLKAELDDEDPGYVESEDGPIDVITKEMERRGLQPLIDQVEGDASSSGRET
jgi:hypothetical protein